jgi:hypothetical protein
VLRFTTPSGVQQQPINVVDTLARGRHADEINSHNYFNLWLYYGIHCQRFSWRFYCLHYVLFHRYSRRMALLIPLVILKKTVLISFIRLGNVPVVDCVVFLPRDQPSRINLQRCNNSRTRFHVNFKHLI